MRKILAIKIVSIIICLLYTYYACAENIAELDTIANNCEKTYCTIAGLRNSNILIRKAQQMGNVYYMCKGLMYKISASVSMGLYTDAISLADSIDEHTNIKNEKPIQYNYIQTQKASAYLMSGDTKPCSEIMQQVCEFANNYIENQNTDDEEYTEVLKLYVNSLKIMAITSFVGQQHEQAMTFFDKAINICRQHPSELYPRFMDIAYCKFSNMSQMVELEGNEAYSKFISEFEQNIHDYTIYAKGLRAPEAIKNDILYYTFSAKSHRLSIAIKEKNIDAAERLVRSLDSLYAVSALVRMRDKDFYDSKSDYYRLIGDYAKALAFNDSVIKKYVAMGAKENEYYAIKKRLKIYNEAGIITEGYDFIARLETLSDTIIKQNTNETLQQLNAQLNVNHTNYELQRTLDEKKMWMTIAIVSILSSIILLVGFLRKRQRN